MIYDCFLFFNEVELLELRVNELSNCIEPVTHILVESRHTFSGKEKPLYYSEVSEKFKDCNIVSLTVENNMEGSTWDRERTQRNMILKGLKFLCATGKSKVIISDIDEIPNHKSVDYFCSINQDFAALQMKKYGYYLNCLESDSWERARIMRYSYLKNKSPEDVRNSGFENMLHNAGWHWSWLGGVDRIVQKFNSFSHQELNNDKYANPEKIAKKLKTGQSLWTDEEEDKWRFVEIDNTFPEYLVNNIDKFKHLIHV